MARPSALASIPTASLHSELQRRQLLARRFAAMRDRLQTKIVAIDARIADWGGAANGVTKRRWAGGPGSRGPRGLRPGSLTSLLAAAIKGKTMSVAEAARAARKAGYRTSAKKFGAHVSLALRNNALFRRVSHGRYTAADRVGGTPNGAVAVRRERGGPRPRLARTRNGRPTLASVLVTAIGGKTMTVTEAVAAARAAGYKTKAEPKGFYHAVAIALAKSGRFKRVSRGRYTAR